MEQEARIPSNRMPAYRPRRLGVVGRAVLAAIGVAVVCSLPWSLAFFGIIAVVSCPLMLIENRRQRRVARERASESICTFARSFNCRETDTWIVRAVFDELGRYVKFPIREEDRLEEDLKIDPEDLADSVEVIAQRTGRSLEPCEQNPLCGKVKTVGELVQFFVDQPQRSSVMGRS